MKKTEFEALITKKEPIDDQQSLAYLKLKKKIILNMNLKEKLIKKSGRTAAYQMAKNEKTLLLSVLKKKT